MKVREVFFVIILLLVSACKKKQSTATSPPPASPAIIEKTYQSCNSSTGHQQSTDGGKTWSTCLSNNQSCSVILSGSKTIGTGNQTWNTSINSWNSCVASSCATGYTLTNGSCLSFNQYLTRFLSLALTFQGLHLSTSNLSIKYDPVLSGTNILGICTRYSGSPALDITINQIYWESWDGQGRNSEMEQLLFHELAHCLLLRGHDTSTMPTDQAGVSIPSTIMNPYHLASRYYEGNYMHYLKELYSVTDGLNILLANGVSAFPTNAYTSMVGIASTFTIKAKTQDEYGNQYLYEKLDPEDAIENFTCDQD